MVHYYRGIRTPRLRNRVFGFFFFCAAFAHVAVDIKVITNKLPKNKPAAGHYVPPQAFNFKYRKLFRNPVQFIQVVELVAHHQISICIYRKGNSEVLTRNCRKHNFSIVYVRAVTQRLRLLLVV